ncbi:transposase [Brucella intermedia]|nr:transposase [Brucella intermedia]MDL2203029.1 transposase [Brucella intermedia]
MDAEAIAEAATRPTMRFAALKSEEQADLQALHRVRDQMIGTRTRLINQMRAFCLEYGIALRQGAGLFKFDLATSSRRPIKRPYVGDEETACRFVCRSAPIGATYQ